ncbi:MAG: hypothetical protein OCD00_10000, partial [Colwellia sp.]
LPEIPDLVYDYLKMDKERHHQQTLLITQLTQQQQSNNQRLISSVLSIGSVIGAALMFGQNQIILASIGLAIGVLFAILALKQ